jgi:hypothetical protein
MVACYSSVNADILTSRHICFEQSVGYECFGIEGLWWFVAAVHHSVDDIVHSASQYKGATKY